MRKQIFYENCNRIDSIFDQLTQEGTIVTDGLIDRDKYLNVNPRILWILKEANSDISWNYRDAFRSDDWLDKCNSLASIRRITYASYGILKSGLRLWEEFPSSKDSLCRSSLEEIAIINIKKTPGGAVANNEELKSAFKKHRELLKLQFETYNPDVIIFCNTMGFVDTADFIGLENATRMVSPYNNHFYYTKDKLYINAYHPSYMKLSDKNYVMDIVSIYRDWIKHK